MYYLTPPLFIGSIYLLIVSTAGILHRIFRGEWWADVMLIEEIYGFHHHPRSSPSYIIWVMFQFILGIFCLILVILDVFIL